MTLGWESLLLAFGTELARNISERLRMGGNRECENQQNKNAQATKTHAELTSIVLCIVAPAG